MRIKIDKFTVICCEYITTFTPCFVKRKRITLTAHCNGKEYCIYFDTQKEAQKALKELFKNGYYDASKNDCE